MYIFRFLKLGVLSLCFLAMPVHAYTTPKAFIDLYFNFTGGQETDFPKNQKTISYALLQSQQRLHKDVFAGPLILILDSSIYIYDKHRKLLYKKLLRTNRASGYYELTAIANIGPALAYLAKMREYGDPSWQPSLLSLLKNIQRVHRLHTAKGENWLKKANIKAWQPYHEQIHTMVDYALTMSEAYIANIQKGQPFTVDDVQNNFLAGNVRFPVPYNNIIVAGFMLNALASMTTMHEEIIRLHLDWPKAMVLIRNHAINNDSAGLTQGTNWMVRFLRALSGRQLAADRIFIVPYALVMPEVGEPLLAENAYHYYVKTVWGELYNRAILAKEIFSQIPSIYLPERPPLPGDYGYSAPDDIRDFMTRFKFSLADSREMVANTASFWMAGELESKDWAINRITIPGLTAGFPKEMGAYPNVPLMDKVLTAKKAHNHQSSPPASGQSAG